MGISVLRNPIMHVPILHFKRSIVDHLIMGASECAVIYCHESCYSKAFCGANALGFPQRLDTLGMAAFFSLHLIVFDIERLGYFYSFYFEGSHATERYLWVIF